MTEAVGTVKKALSREFVILSRSELEEMLKDLRNAATYLERHSGQDDCGLKVCQAQIRLIEGLLEGS